MTTIDAIELGFAVTLLVVYCLAASPRFWRGGGRLRLGIGRRRNNKRD